MDQNGKSSEHSSQAKCDIQNAASKENSPHTPGQDSVAKRYYENAERWTKNIAGKRVRSVITWLDDHNGAVTAAATVAIAILTYSLASVSRGQLAQMHDDSVSGSAASKAQLDILTSQAQTAALQAQALKDTSEAQRLIAESASGQLEETKNSGRAWIGVTGANILTLPKVGQDLLISVQYSNTGREPGRNFANNAMNDKPFPIISDNINSPGVLSFMQEHSDECLELHVDPKGGQIINPTTAIGAGYSTLPTARGEIVTGDIVNGGRALVVEGCFAYYTRGMPHHTSFCVFWDKKISQNLVMNFCPAGNDGD